MAIKLTQAQLVELAQAAVAEDVEVVDQADPDYKLDDALQKIDGSRSAILKPRWESESMEALRQEIAGKSGGTLRSTLRRITGIELDAMKGKGDAEAITAAIEFMKGTLTAEQGDVQKRIDDILAANNKEWEDRYKTTEQDRDEWKGKYERRDNISAVQKTLKAAPLPEKLDRNIASEDFYNYLNSKFITKVVNGELELFDKTNPSIPAMNGSQKIKVIDEAKAFFEPRNNWQTDMRNASAASAMNNGQQFTPPVPAAQPATPADYGTQLTEASRQAAAKLGIQLPA